MVVERLQETRRQRRVIKWCLKHPDAPWPEEVVQGLAKYRAYPELQNCTLEEYYDSFELPLFDLRHRYESIMHKRPISDANRKMIRRELEYYAAWRKDQDGECAYVAGCSGIGCGH